MFICGKYSSWGVCLILWVFPILSLLKWDRLLFADFSDLLERSLDRSLEESLEGSLKDDLDGSLGNCLEGSRENPCFYLVFILWRRLLFLFSAFYEMDDRLVWLLGIWLNKDLGTSRKDGGISAWGLFIILSPELFELKLLSFPVKYATFYPASPPE